MALLRNSLLLLTSFAALVVKADPSPGCGLATPSGTTLGTSKAWTFVTSDNVTRTYRMYVPSTYNINNPTQLIFAFHGRGSSGSQQESLTQLSSASVNPSAIAVYPDGLAGSDGQTQWQGDPMSLGVNDVLFINDLLTNLTNTFCIDTLRTYASGQSNGGQFTNKLACDPLMSQRFAAFAPSSGAFYTDNLDSNCTSPATVPISCNPCRADIPVLEFHGLADGTIPYNGGGRRGYCLPSIPHWVTFKANLEGYYTNVSTPLYGGNVTQYQYGGGLVTHYAIAGLGHDWATLSNSPISATALMLSYFANYTLPSATLNTTCVSGAPPTQVTPIPTAQAKSAHYVHKGCIRDPNGARAFPNQSLVTTTMTPDQCTAFCLSKGLRWAGLEYATQCFCGDRNRGGTVVAAASCSMRCGGNGGGVQALCGGGSLMNAYYSNTL